MTVLLISGAGRPSHVTGLEAKDFATARVSTLSIRPVLSNVTCFRLLFQMFFFKIMFSPLFVFLPQIVELNGVLHHLIQN